MGASAFKGVIVLLEEGVGEEVAVGRLRGGGGMWLSSVGFVGWLGTAWPVSG